MTTVGAVGVGVGVAVDGMVGVGDMAGVSVAVTADVLVAITSDAMVVGGMTVLPGSDLLEAPGLLACTGGWGGRKSRGRASTTRIITPAIESTISFWPRE